MTRKSAGIMTFHWAANYGAVLQSWALQEYLLSIGLDVELINYIPREHNASFARFLKAKKPSRKLAYYRDYRKNKYLEVFRNKYLIRSKCSYQFKEQLKLDPPLYEVYISGSDQIWNPYFTMHGQKGLTLSYYLDFAPMDAKRIAFSSSFGLSNISDEMKAVIAPELRKFSRISVREKSGTDILASMGINAALTADPTLLLSADSYRKLISPKKKAKELFFYCLHGQRNDAINDVRAFAKSEDLVITEDCCKGIEEWLQQIDGADFVITNSFHGVVFCILFHVPFVAFEKKTPNMEMGNRLTTLLGAVGLEERFCSLEDLAEQLQYLKKRHIDWESIDLSVALIRKNAQSYLREALGELPVKTIENIDSRKCTGCGMCTVICPVKCISMKENKQGFMVPCIDTVRCIQCGLCYKECIAIDTPEGHDKPLCAYSCYHTDEVIRRGSSSGGAFSALAAAFIANGGKVIGAAYAGELEVKHICIDNEIEIERLRGSKYLPSNAWEIFSNIKSMLEKGERVLFSGTPCQVAAVRKYTGNPSQLTCVDLACHGIPSSLVVRAHCAEIAQNVGATVNRIDFRDKISGWKDFSFSYWNGSRKLSSEHVYVSPLGRAYVNNLISRSSCLNCPFACEQRQGDITLCDHWRLVHLGVDTENKGVTGALVNSPKGQRVFEDAEKYLHIEKTTHQEIIAGNPVLAHVIGPNPMRTDFFRVLCQLGYHEAKRKYCMPPSVINRSINKAKRMILK